MGLAIQHDVSLAPLTTLELGGPARYFATVESIDELRAALAWADAEQTGVYILAGGSNLVIADSGVDGLVIHCRLRGVEAEDRGGCVLVRAAAGESWDGLVAWSVARDLVGIEAMSGIPGTVGATPIQNVGAYGQEVADRIEAVEVLDRMSGQTEVMPASACGFRYRDSVFRRDQTRRVVLAVRFLLARGLPGPPRYAELAAALADVAVPRAADVREAVLRLRRAKSMVLDPSDENRRSVGSFFTNPIVGRDVLATLERVAVTHGLVESPAAVPRWYLDGDRVKLAAAWLIEQAGFPRGTRRGNVGLSSRHSLALVHHGGGSTGELLAFARDAAARVHARFGVTLAPEPILWAVAW